MISRHIADRIAAIGVEDGMTGLGTRKSYSGEINFQIVEKHDDHVIGKMPVSNGIINRFGTVHAGAILWFADVAATVLANPR